MDFIRAYHLAFIKIHKLYKVKNRVFDRNLVEKKLYGVANAKKIQKKCYKNS